MALVLPGAADPVAPGDTAFCDWTAASASVQLSGRWLVRFHEASRRVLAPTRVATRVSDVVMGVREDVPTPPPEKPARRVTPVGGVHRRGCSRLR